MFIHQSSSAMKRIIFTLIIVFTGVLFLTDCTKTVRVGFLMDESTTGRWERDKEIFSKNIQELGGEVVVASAEMDPDKQYEQAQEMLDGGVDVLVIVPADMDKAAEIVVNAHKNGIRVVSYDRLIKNCGVDYYVSFDHVDVGELQAQYLTSACPSGDYAILGGAMNDNNSFLLKLGQLNVLQPIVDRGDIRIVYDNFASEWSVEEGYRLMKDCLKKNKEVVAVLAANDRLASGAIKALNEAGLEDVCVAGMDADLDACQRIIAGEQSMTVYKPIEAIAVKAAEVAMQIALEDDAPNMNISVNNGFKQVPAVLLPSMVVSSETIDLTVVADGYLQEHNIRQ